MAEHEQLVVVRDLHKSFGSLAVLRDVNLQVARGEVVVVIGRSGSGKTTLLRCLNFLAEYERGEVYIDGKLMWYQEASCRRRRSSSEIAADRVRIGMVFQHFNLFPHRRILDNIIMAPVRVNHCSRAEAEATARELLQKVGLSDKAQEYPANLSGGQQQRVAIARALAMKPEIMLFDEVTSALDPELTGDVLATIKQLADEGMTMILVTHEMHFALEVADRIVFMDEGLIVEEGLPAQILFQPKTDRLQEFLRRFREYVLLRDRVAQKIL